MNAAVGKRVSHGGNFLKVTIMKYNGYQLEANKYDLTERQLELIDACIWLVDNRQSIRVTGKNMNVKKSTLGKFLKDGELRGLSYGLYQVVRKQIKRNIHILNVKNRRDRR